MRVLAYHIVVGSCTINYIVSIICNSFLLSVLLFCWCLKNYVYDCRQEKFCYYISDLLADNLGWKWSALRSGDQAAQLSRNAQTLGISTTDSSLETHLQGNEIV